MRRHRLLLGVGVLALLLGVAGPFLLLRMTSPEPGITWENFRRIRVGMTAREVELLLGRRPDYHKPIDTAGRFSESWLVDYKLLLIEYRTDGLVSDGLMRDNDTNDVELLSDKPGGFLDRLRRLLRL
jgi:hypothetical protein